MTRVLGVGVVGLGWMGTVHTRAWTRLTQHYGEHDVRIRLAAVADPLDVARPVAWRGGNRRVPPTATLTKRASAGISPVAGRGFPAKERGGGGALSAAPPG